MLIVIGDEPSTRLAAGCLKTRWGPEADQRLVKACMSNRWGVLRDDGDDRGKSRDGDCLEPVRRFILPGAPNIKRR